MTIEQILGAIVLGVVAYLAAFTPPGRHLMGEAWASILAGLSTVRRSTRESLCGVKGHEYIRHSDGEHHALLCVNCWRETPGLRWPR